MAVAVAVAVAVIFTSPPVPLSSPPRYPPAWSTEANLTASAYYENTSLLRLNPWKYVSQYVRVCPCVRMSVCLLFATNSLYSNLSLCFRCAITRVRVLT